MNNIRDNGLSTNILFWATFLKDETKYAVQTCELPSVMINHQQFMNRSGQINLQGDVAEYMPMNITFIIDSKLERWKDIIGVIQTYQTPGTSECNVMEGTAWVEVQDNSNNYLFRVVLHNTYLKEVGALRYSSGDDDDILTLECTLVYDYFTIE